MIELAAVGSPPPQQGSSFVIRFYFRKIIFFIYFIINFNTKRAKSSQLHISL